MLVANSGRPAGPVLVGSLAGILAASHRRIGVTPRRRCFARHTVYILGAMDKATEPDADWLRQRAVEVLRIEAQAIAGLESRLDEGFARACTLVLQCTGRVVVSGMGKSGHIARKIAATFASTGTPAFFVHPAEASHGDLGMVTRGDRLLALPDPGA